VRKSIPVIMREKMCSPEPDMYIIIAFMGILQSKNHPRTYVLAGAIAISHAFLTFKSSCCSRFGMSSLPFFYNQNDVWGDNLLKLSMNNHVSRRIGNISSCFCWSTSAFPSKTYFGVSRWRFVIHRGISSMSTAKLAETGVGLLVWENKPGSLRDLGESRFPESVQHTISSTCTEAGWAVSADLSKGFQRDESIDEMYGYMTV
jgi:hypothetical protein